MTNETANLEAPDEADRDLPGSEPEPGSAERSQRLRQAVRAAGGNAAVARRAGMPVGTLNRYMAGRQMRAGALVALAEATGVRLEWLATGRGAMQGAAEAPPAPPPAAEAGPLRLFGRVPIDRLVRAYEGALASSGGDRRLTMHLTLMLYDQLAEAEESRAAAPSTDG